MIGSTPRARRARRRADAAERRSPSWRCSSAAWSPPGWSSALLRGSDAAAGSVWFGDRIVDGVLFPVLALLFAYRGAHRCSRRMVKPAVFRLAIPILVSLRRHPPQRARPAAATFPNVAAGCASSSAASRGSPGSRSCCGSPACCRWCSMRWTTCSWKIGAAQITLRNLVEGALTAGVVLVLALWVSAAIERELLATGSGHDLSLRKMAANVAARAAAVRRPAVRAVGGRHRPDGAVGARRRDRRRPRLRPAEDRRQLRQRLRHPRRAERCASATWSRSTTSKAASPTSAPATR